MKCNKKYVGIEINEILKVVKDCRDILSVLFFEAAPMNIIEGKRDKISSLIDECSEIISELERSS